VLLIRRRDNGLLGGMLQPPLGAWGDTFPSHAEAMAQAPFRGSWSKRAGNIRHGFTHFELEIEVYVADFAKRPKHEGNWVAPDKLARAALPTVMRKIIAHAHPNIMRPSRSGDNQHGVGLTEPQLPHGHHAKSARSR
jgi:A/G-specific adenine glycosylase